MITTTDIANVVAAALVLILGLTAVFRWYIPWLIRRQARRRELSEIKKQVVHS